MNLKIEANLNHRSSIIFLRFDRSIISSILLVIDRFDYIQSNESNEFWDRSLKSPMRIEGTTKESKRNRIESISIHSIAFIYFFFSFNHNLNKSGNLFLFFLSFVFISGSLSSTHTHTNRQTLDSNQFFFYSYNFERTKKERRNSYGMVRRKMNVIMMREREREWGDGERERIIGTIFAFHSLQNSNFGLKKIFPLYLALSSSSHHLFFHWSHKRFWIDFLFANQ